MNYISNATADLIAKARNLHEGIPMGDGERDLCQACSPERMPCEVIQLADALESATRVPAIDPAMIERFKQGWNAATNMDLFGGRVHAGLVAALDGAPEPEWLPVEGESK